MNRERVENSSFASLYAGYRDHSELTEHRACRVQKGRYNISRLIQSFLNTDQEVGVQLAIRIRLEIAHQLQGVSPGKSERMLVQDILDAALSCRIGYRHLPQLGGNMEGATERRRDTIQSWPLSKTRLKASTLQWQRTCYSSSEPPCWFNVG